MQSHATPVHPGWHRHFASCNITAYGVGPYHRCTVLYMHYRMSTAHRLQQNRITFSNFLYSRLVRTYYGMALPFFFLSVSRSVGLSTKLVNTKQTEPLKLGSSNLIHILLMTRRQTLLIFKVSGHTLHIVVKPCKHDTDWTVPARTVKLGSHTTVWQVDEPYWFSRSGVKGQGHTLHIVFKLCKKETSPFQLGPSN